MPTRGSCAGEQRGWKTQEPDPLPVEKPQRFLQSIRRAESEKLISPQEAAEMLNERDEVMPSGAMLALMREAGHKATETARAELSAKGIAPMSGATGRLWKKAGSPSCLQWPLSSPDYFVILGRVQSRECS